MQQTARRRPYPNGPLAQLGIRAGYNNATDRAAAVGCSKSHVQHCEGGFTLPGLDLVSRMALAYGVTGGEVEAAARKCIKVREQRARAR